MFVSCRQGLQMMSIETRAKGLAHAVVVAAVAVGVLAAGRAEAADASAAATATTATIATTGASAATGATAVTVRRDAIGVAPFRADGVDPVAVRALTDILAAELEKFAGVNVVTHTELAAVLDQAAEAELMGCVETQCLHNVAAMLPTRRLLSGSVGRIGSTLIVNAALIDLATLTVITRISAPVGNDLDSARAGLKTIALAVVTGDPSALPDDAALTGEVSAELLQRVIIAERTRGPGVRVLGGTVLSMTFAIGEPSDPHYPGGSGRIVVDVPFAPWWSAVVAAGGSYHTGEFLTRANLIVPNGTTTLSTAGSFTSALGIADGFLGVGVALQPPTGVVRPYVAALVTGDLLVLDIADLVFQPDQGQPALPDAFAQPTRFKESIAPGAGGELALGIDFSVLAHVAIGMQISTHMKLHGLQKIASTGGTVQTTPLPSLVGSEIQIGATYEF